MTKCGPHRVRSASTNTSRSPVVTSSDFHSASPLPGNAPSAGAMSRARCTAAPACAAAANVLSVESESMTTTSSTSGVPVTRAARIAWTTPATVRSSLRAGITTLIRAPARCLAASNWLAGQSRQCDVRWPSQLRARSGIPGPAPGELAGGTTGMLPGGPGHPGGRRAGPGHGDNQSCPLDLTTDQRKRGREATLLPLRRSACCAHRLGSGGAGGSQMQPGPRVERREKCQSSSL